MNHPDCKCFQIAPALRDELIDDAVMELYKPLGEAFNKAYVCSKAMPYMIGAVLAFTTIMYWRPDFAVRDPLLEQEDLDSLLKMVDDAAAAAKDRIQSNQRAFREARNAAN